MGDCVQERWEVGQNRLRLKQRAFREEADPCGRDGVCVFDRAQRSPSLPGVCPGYPCGGHDQRWEGGFEVGISSLVAILRVSGVYAELRDVS